MRIAILSGGDGWHVQDLLRAATALNHTAVPLDFRRLNSANSLQDFDAILVRTMPAGSLEQIIFRMDLLHEAMTRGVLVLNPPRALETCVDKYLTNVRLAEASVPVPKTIACQTAEDAMQAFETLGRDVVVKPIFGSEGRGMVRVTDPEIAWRTFQTLQNLQFVIYIQEYIQHPGWDVRVFVIDGFVVAAMKRTNCEDWRTNIARGGMATRHLPRPEECAIAIVAASATGAKVAGVDIVYDGMNKMYVVEVNAVPGWRALSTTCEHDIATDIIHCAARLRR